MQLFGDGHKFVTDETVNVDAPMFHRIIKNDTWADILGVDNAGHNVLISLRDDTSNDIPNSPTTGGNGAGIAFGGIDTKGILTMDWLNPTAKMSAGNADKPTWSEEIAWKSDIQKLQAEIDQLKQNK